MSSCTKSMCENTHKLLIDKIKMDKVIGRLEKNGWRRIRFLHHFGQCRYYIKNNRMCLVDIAGNYKITRVESRREKLKE